MPRKPEPGGRSTRYVILGVLNVFGPLTGYGIRKTIAESIDFMWSESYGQLYPELERLEAEGLVRAVVEKGDNPRGAQPFAITAAGRRALAAWLKQPAAREPARVEHLVKLFFGREADEATNRGHILEVLRSQEARLAAFAGIRASIEAGGAQVPDLVYWQIVLRSGELQAQARKRWAEESLALLDAARSSSRRSGGNAAVMRKARS